MIAARRVAGILLASGLSRRYGKADKLLADYRGMPLAARAIRAMTAIDLGARFAVVRASAPKLRLLFDGGPFELIENDRPRRGMSSSIALGVAVASARDIDAVLICLADMPHIDRGLLTRLLECFDRGRGILACSDGVRRSPPVLFGRVHFDALSRLEGDRGAQAMISGAPVLKVTPDQLADFDMPF